MEERWFKHATLLKVTLFRGCFSCFQNCTNGTKSRNASQSYNQHCMKGVQIPSFSGPYFPAVGLNTKTLYSVQTRENMDQKKLCIWTPFMQWKW